MRYAAKSDASQERTVDDLRAMGYSVLVMSRLGHDAPDLLIAKHGVDQLVECKTPIGHYTPLQCLSPGQIEFRACWRGAPIIAAFDAISVARVFDARLHRLGVYR